MFFNWAKKLYVKFISLFKRTKPPLTGEQLLELFIPLIPIYKEGNYGKEHLDLLIEIGGRLPTHPGINQAGRGFDKICFHTVTSNGLLESVRHHSYTKAGVLYSNIIYIERQQKTLNRWWSNDSSVHYFLDFMSGMLVENRKLMEDRSVKLRKGVREFLESFLFRLLMNDYISLVELLLKKVVEDERRQASARTA